MSHSLYDKLIAVLDVFIDEFGGQMKLRGVQTALLIRQATLENRGISITEIQQVTSAPLESIRRHLSQRVEQGLLSSQPDPEDERIVRYRATDESSHHDSARRMAERLAAVHATYFDPPLEQPPRPFDKRTYEELIAVLQAFANTMDSGLRIRGFKFAIVIQQATKMGTGLTASEISRNSGAPLETVRRYIQTYTEMGNLTTLEDPEDSRKTRVMYKEPGWVDVVLDQINADLEAVNWSRFKLI